LKYLASELLVFFIAFAALFSVATCVAILFILMHEGSKWCVRRLREATKAAALSVRAQSRLTSGKFKVR